MTVYEVVQKLIGPIEPLGETHMDNARYDNLKQMAELAECILGDLKSVAAYKDRQEYSMRRAGEFADRFLWFDLGVDE